MELPIGVILQLQTVLEHGMGELEEMGISYCQLCCWDSSLFTKENAQKVKEIIKDKIILTSLWVGWGGPAVWNFIEGPATLGLVPAAYRTMRIDSLKKGADFAEMLGLHDIITHVGFLPETPASAAYAETVAAVREVAEYCEKKSLYFNFETGQETPTTLMRTIEDVHTRLLGINLDPANLLLYGKANPVDAAGIFKDKVRSVHVKDGCYPVNGQQLGQEMPVGEGMVNFPALLPKLISYGFRGPLIIEREISGEQQKYDILQAKAMLESILQKV